MKKLSLLAVVVVLIGTACQRESSYPDVTSMPVEENGEKEALPAGKLLAQMIFDSVAYVVQPEEMLQPFITEFGDGTVVDKAMIRRVTGTDKKEKPNYYVVGIGMKNGDFRMMALELYASSDNSLYVTPQSRKYVTTSDECDFCMFTFSRNLIAGAECQNRDINEECTFLETETNSFMR